MIRLSEREVVVRFQRRAHNPLLLAAGFGETDVAIPWLGKKRCALNWAKPSWCKGNKLTQGVAQTKKLLDRGESPVLLGRFTPRGNPG